MKRTLRLALLPCFLLFYSCGSDDGGGTGTGGGTSVDTAVSSVQSLDLGNDGNASDIRLSFEISSNEASVDHYRVFVVKSTVQGFTTTFAEGLAATSYFRIEKTGDNIETDLSASVLDSEGAAVVEGTEYVIFVMSIGTSGVNSTMKAATKRITLAQTDISEILAEMPIGTGGITVDADGNIYCADFGASLTSSPGTVLYKVTPEGETSVFATGFNGASGNTIGPDGNIYQSNIVSGEISKVTMDGTVTTYATGLTSPVGLVFDSSGNLYATDCGDGTIKKIAPDGTVTVFSSGSSLACPNGITIDENDNLYVANFGFSTVLKITPDGTPSVLANLPGNSNAHLTYRNGALYVTARVANLIYKITLDGTATVLAGTGTRGHAIGPALESEFSIPNAIAFSPDGKFLYVNDKKPLTGNLITPSFLKRITLDTN